MPTSINQFHKGDNRDLDLLILPKDTSRRIQNMRYIEIDGKKIAEKLPATFLLGLETKLNQLEEFIKTIPTLPATSEWKEDKTKGIGIYSATQPTITYRTRKELQHKILVPATKEHPAKVEKWTENINIGRFIKTTWSGLFPMGEKMEMIKRVRKLKLAVKEARQRANNTDVNGISVGKILTNYIQKGL